MALLTFLRRLSHSRLIHTPPLWSLALGVLVLWILTFLIPVGQTLWAEVLTISGEVQTGQWIFTETPTETPTPTSTPTWLAQAGTTLEATKTAQTRWMEGTNFSIFIVYGQICVTNEGDYPTVGLRILDQVEIKPQQGDWQPLENARLEIAPAEQLAPGEMRCFDYEIAVPWMERTAYRNTAQTTILNHSGWLPGGKHCPGPEACPFGPTCRAGFEPPTTGEIIPGPTQTAPSDEGDIEAPLPRGWQPSATPTFSPTPTSTFTPTPTLTSTEILTPQPTPTETPTPFTPNSTSTPTVPPTPTETPPPTPTPAETPTPTQTPVPPVGPPQPVPSD
ncbi:hypothetical protein SE15_00480 [Thermanaerothrix daxensis]|uniref:Uncharacterized protein n=1 Tax=Thermanaerothrix daxensis TaxID=869279 RepID=A0A0P6Y3W9_9CHLR|nr:hypothetical protein [Thermanaerothrix daxensis]KPL83773.1 hypothetical protein SE15_00480 [Thermanaerothrix daxensis]